MGEAIGLLAFLAFAGLMAWMMWLAGVSRSQLGVRLMPKDEREAIDEAIREDEHALQVLRDRDHRQKLKPENYA